MSLKKIDTGGPKEWMKEDIKEKTIALLEEFGELHKRLHAEGKQSVLLILQGMDASGKDGLVRDLFCNSSPVWLRTESFKRPTEEEYSHDFLWRINKVTPAAGIITVFNRSQYEDILVPSVYGYLPKKVIDMRYEQINDFEALLESSGTRIVKCYLHISLERQEERLLQRTTDKTKFWKHNDSDWETREKWSEFMKVYEKIFVNCSRVSWHIIPSDMNWVKLYMVLELMIATLKDMNPKYPPLVSAHFGNVKPVIPA